MLVFQKHDKEKKDYLCCVFSLKMRNNNCPKKSYINVLSLKSRHRRRKMSHRKLFQPNFS